MNATRDVYRSFPTYSLAQVARWVKASPRTSFTPPALCVSAKGDLFLVGGEIASLLHTGKRRKRMARCHCFWGGFRSGWWLRRVSLVVCVDDVHNKVTPLPAVLEVSFPTVPLRFLSFFGKVDPELLALDLAKNNA